LELVFNPSIKALMDYFEKKIFALLSLEEKKQSSPAVSLFQSDDEIARLLLENSQEAYNVKF